MDSKISHARPPAPGSPSPVLHEGHERLWAKVLGALGPASPDAAELRGRLELLDLSVGGLGRNPQALDWLAVRLVRAGPQLLPSRLTLLAEQLGRLLAAPDAGGRPTPGAGALAARLLQPGPAGSEAALFDIGTGLCLAAGVPAPSPEDGARPALWQCLVTSLDPLTPAAQEQRLFAAVEAAGGDGMASADMEALAKALFTPTTDGPAGPLARPEAVRGWLRGLGGPHLASPTHRETLERLLAATGALDPEQTGDLVFGVAGAAGGPPLPPARLEGLADSLLAAVPTLGLARLRGAIEGLVAGAGGPDLSDADLDRLLARLAPVAGAAAPEMLLEVGGGLAFGLGGPEMPAGRRQALIDRLAARAQGLAPQPAALMLSGALSAMAVDLRTDLREACHDWLTRADAPWTRLQRLGALTAFGWALGGQQMEPGRRTWVLERLAAPGLDATVRGAGHEALACALGGVDIPEAHRQALLDSVLAQAATLSREDFSALVFRLVLGLGGGQMPQAQAQGLMARLLQAAPPLAPRALADACLGLGRACQRGPQAARCIRWLLDTALAPAAALSPASRTAAASGLLEALGGPQVSDANLDVVTRRILQAAPALPAEHRQALGEALARALGGPQASHEHLLRIEDAIREAMAQGLDEAAAGHLFEGLGFGTGHDTMSALGRQWHARLHEGLAQMGGAPADRKHPPLPPSGGPADRKAERAGDRPGAERLRQAGGKARYDEG